MPLGEIEQGEQLLGTSGAAVVLSHTILQRSTPVYSIEVHGQHVYQVGTLGVLVHNAADDCLAAPRKGLDYKWVDEGAEALVRRTGDTLEAFEPIYTHASDFSRMIFGLEDVARGIGANQLIVKNVGLGFGPALGNAAKTRAMLERYGGVFEYVGDDILGPIYNIIFKVVP